MYWYQINIIYDFVTWIGFEFTSKNLVLDGRAGPTGRVSGVKHPLNNQKLWYGCHGTRWGFTQIWRILVGFFAKIPSQTRFFTRKLKKYLKNLRFAKSNSNISVVPRKNLLFFRFIASLVSFTFPTAFLEKSSVVWPLSAAKLLRNSANYMWRCLYFRQEQSWKVELHHKFEKNFALQDSDRCGSVFNFKKL